MQEYVKLYQTNKAQLKKEADEKCREIHGNNVYLRGLLEFSNYCTMNCNYCGIRNGNAKVRRYRIMPNEIIYITSEAFRRGFRTFVLQSGEDSFYTDKVLEMIISSIKEKTNGEAAVTLSVGIRTKKSYKRLKNAGADRFLMRFETSDSKMYSYFKNGQSLEKRINTILDLKNFGYETGSGFMTGLPGETEETLVNNALLCKKLELDMVGIGPYIPHKDTPLYYENYDKTKSIEKVCNTASLVRLLLPETHIPATTAAGSVHPHGREMMIQSGANVLMSNITPVKYKGDYLLYPGKICLDEDYDTCLNCLKIRTRSCEKELSLAKAGALRLKK